MDYETWDGVLEGGPDFKDDQCRVLNRYFNDNVRVSVSAGAGTGKTTLLVEIISESVARFLKDNQEENPFEEILAVTFNVEAARQIKSDVKERLEEHYREVGSTKVLKDIKRWIENESWIQTIDSLTRELLSEVNFDADLNSISDVPDEYELGQIRDEIIENLESSSEIEEEIQLLSSEFPDQARQNQRGWIDLLEDCFDKSRLYCLSADEFGMRLENTFKNTLYRSYEPPFTPDQIEEIYQGVRRDECPDIPIERVNQSYRHNKKILENLQRVLEEYEKRYNTKTKSNGLLSHNDARYWMVRYAEGKVDNKYRESWIDTQKNRFEHVLVDEFQDTSYSQCALLKYFIGEDSNVFLIGDPKQTIYEWRAAEPEIFNRILNSIPENRISDEIPFLEASNFRKEELVSNFRSTEPIINMTNDIFGENSDSIFNKDLYTAGREIPHSDLEPKSDMPNNEINEPNIHAFTLDGENLIPNILHEIDNGRREIHVRKKDNDGNLTWEQANLGDCCILLQSKQSHWPELREELIENDISYVMIAEKGLFDRPEISLIIDALDWFKNPHNKDALIRILRSPIVGVSDKALRYLSSKDYNLSKILEENDNPEWFEEEGNKRLLEGLINIRDDLRWLREGRKTEMVENIIKYSHLDNVILTSREGDQNLANIRTLLEIISSWEEEELLTYDELLERLKYFRESDEDAYNIAVLNDEENEDSVKIATVHAVKGLEFPIVFPFYPQLDLVSQWGYHNRNKNIFVKNTENEIAREIAIRQTVPGDLDNDDWENNFTAENGLAGPCESCGELFYDDFNRKTFSEKSRLYYVALTRAKDHVFHRWNDCRHRFCWQHIFNNWIEELSTDSRNDIDVIEELEPISTEEPTIPETEFDPEKFEILSEKTCKYTPKVINPSHLYDLIKCPRRYQYAVLQKVSGGESCLYGQESSQEQRFGFTLHAALELSDFQSDRPNIEYTDYIERISSRNETLGNKVDTAMKKFFESDIFDNLNLKDSPAKKEINILLNLDSGENEKEIILNNKVDLLIKDGDNIIIADYKTKYPDDDDPGSEYIRNHVKFQLRAYALAVERGLGKDVSNLICLYYDSKHEKWEQYDIEYDLDELENEILNCTEIDVIDNGLERNTDFDFCREDLCEFYELCTE